MGEQDPIDLAARALEQRDHSRQEIEEKLARAGIDEDARAESLATLERLGYIDDGRFTADRAAVLAARGYGDAYIRFDLQRHGADAESVESALAALEPESARARELAAQLGAGPKVIAKLSARLSRKGFSDESLEELIAAFGDVA